MRKRGDAPRILVVTPEVTCVPHGMGPASQTVSARSGGLGDICAAHIDTLFKQGFDVHLAIPNYRNIFEIAANSKPGVDIHRHKRKLPEKRIHLAQDRSFYYHPKLFLSVDRDTIQMALAFQREVINRILPEVQPDLIHCYDWMTGLIPPLARHLDIPCLFTVYRLDTPKLLLSTIEDRGIDAASFWRYCFYDRMPINYHETRDTNPVDLLASGLFGANIANTLSQSFLEVLTNNTSHHTNAGLKTALRAKLQERLLCAVAPAPDPSLNPASDRSLMRTYGPDTQYAGKLFNKLHLQELLNLRMDTTSPLCLWPTRLDGTRPGSRLMAEMLPVILERYQKQRIQVVFVADGHFKDYIAGVIHGLDAGNDVAVCDFDARRYRLAFGAAEFVLMPLQFDPCAMPCKIGQRYGALPIAHDAGAIHDCVTHLDITTDHGTGFLFKHFDRNGFLWAIDQAMTFYGESRSVRSSQVQRIMRESLVAFDSETSALTMIGLYNRLMNRPMVTSKDESDFPYSSQIAA